MQKPESHILSDQKDHTEGSNDGGEEIEQDVDSEDEMLLGQHDQPLHLHRHRSKAVTFQNDMVRRSCLALNLVPDGTPTLIDTIKKVLLISPLESKALLTNFCAATLK